MAGELQTFKELLDSNSSFYAAINNSTVCLDQTLTYELILLYFKVNYRYLENLNLPNQEDIERIVKDNDYTIEDSMLISNGKKYYAVYFKYIIDLIEEAKEVKETVVTQIPFHHNNVIKFQSKPAEVIDLKPFLHQSDDSREYFETSTILDEYSRPYISSIQRSFRSNFSKMIIKLLGIDELSNNDLLFVYSMLNLYAYTYADSKYPSIIKSIKLPQNAIGIRKTTYKPDVLKDYNMEMARIGDQREKYFRAERAFEASNSMTPLREQYLNGCLNKLNEDEYNAELERYFRIHTNEVYNPNLLHYLEKSIESGLVDFDDSEDNPVIKFFYISNLGQVEFHSSMRLETFIHLLDNEQTIKIISTDEKPAYTKR